MNKAKRPWPDPADLRVGNATALRQRHIAVTALALRPRLQRNNPPAPKAGGNKTACPTTRTAKAGPQKTARTGKTP